MNRFRVTKKPSVAEQAAIWHDNYAYISIGRALRKEKNARRVIAREEQQRQWRLNRG